MSAPLASKIIRAPGRLLISPTNLSAAYPYGGIEIGKVRAVVLKPLGTNAVVMSEGLGEATDILEANNRWVLSCFVRGWDDDAVQQLQSDSHSIGAVTQHALFTYPLNARPGSSGLSRAKALIYVPDDIVNAPCVLAYRAIPNLDDGAQLEWQRNNELGMPMAFELLRGVSGKILQIGRLPDLTL